MEKNYVVLDLTGFIEAILPDTIGGIPVCVLSLILWEANLDSEYAVADLTSWMLKQEMPYPTETITDMACAECMSVYEFCTEKKLEWIAALENMSEAIDVVYGSTLEYFLTDGYVITGISNEMSDWELVVEVMSYDARNKHGHGVNSLLFELRRGDDFCRTFLRKRFRN